MLAYGTLDGFIADLLETKLRLIASVQGEVPPDASILDDRRRGCQSECCGRMRT